MLDWYDVKDFLILILGVTLFVFLVLGPIIGLCILAEKQACDTLALIDPDHDYRFTFWTGCLVQTPTGRWVHWQRSGYHDVDIVGR